jgi:hypothetical protein
MYTSQNTNKLSGVSDAVKIKKKNNPTMKVINRGKARKRRPVGGMGIRKTADHNKNSAAKFTKHHSPDTHVSTHEGFKTIRISGQVGIVKLSKTL